MTVQVKFEHLGAIKYYTGLISGNDILDADRQIKNHPEFESLKFVIAVYIGVNSVDICIADQTAILRSRAESFQENPLIKYAFVTDDELIASRLRESKEMGELLYPLLVTRSLIDAVSWASN